MNNRFIPNSLTRSNTKDNPMNSNDIQTLYEYNRWANNKLLRAAAKMSQEQLAAPTWLSGGTLLATLNHAIDTEWSWRLVCQEGAMTGTYLEFADFASLRKAWREEMKHMLAYVSLLTDEQLQHIVTYTRPRFRPRQRPLWQILMHIINHSTHHRAEIGQYLATCGCSPGDMDFMIFVAK
jgi:uncharacterized damage-inducible protein DinB